MVLDIGGDIGALILMTGPDLLLAEIEITRVDGGPVPGHEHANGEQHHEQHQHEHDGDEHQHQHGGDRHGHVGGRDRPVAGGVPVDAPRTHVAVRERRGPGGSRFAAIYPELRRGDYVVWDLDGNARQTVTIVGGEVASLDWR